MRLIDADAFDKALSDAQAECKRNGGNFRFGVLSNVRGNISKMPSVDAVPVVHGRWIGKRYNFKTYEMETVPYDPMSFDDIDELTCSVCGKHSLLNGHEEDVPSNYCPNCGAKMDLEG